MTQTRDAVLCSGLMDLARRHRIKCYTEHHWAILSDAGLMLAGYVETEPSQPEDGSMSPGRMVPVTFRAMGRDDADINIVLAGAGGSQEIAKLQALDRFRDCAFHVLIRAYVDPSDQQATQRRRIVGGRVRIVTLGAPIFQTHEGAPLESEGQWRDELFKIVEDSALAQGTHWIDAYYGNIDGRVLVDIRLDNETWTWAEERMSSASWPVARPLVTARLFLIVQDFDDPVRARPGKSLRIVRGG